MSGSKGKIIFAILAVLLLLFGGGITLYPFLNGLWVNQTMHRDAEEFLLLLEETPEESQGETTYVIVGEPGAAESAEPLPPAEHTQLWLDMKAYNETIFREGQEGLSDPAAYEMPSFRLSDYGLDSEVFGVLSIPRLELRMPIYLGATKENMANGAAVMGQTSLPIGGNNTNCVLAGHRGWNGAAYFLYVDRLIPGDTVIITNLWETLNYKVSDIKVISPNDVETIHIQSNRELLTLLTCHPPASGGKQRYLVFCERTDNMEVS
ncbi:MAG: class C sortase [Faecousia sp.]